MMGPTWTAPDDVLLESIARALQTDPVPFDVLRQARSSFAWRDLAAEIALLEFDSAIDDDGLVRVRALPSARRLYFRTGQLVVSLEVHQPQRKVVGRIEPAGSVTLELRHQGGSSVVDSDRYGYFAFDHLPPGAISLRWQPTGQDRVVETEWVTL
jgi:hypothetical protein